MTNILRFIGLFIFFLLLSLPCVAVAKPKNESDIQINGESKRLQLDHLGHRKHRKGEKGIEGPVKWCQGTVPSNVNLGAVKITPEDLKNGVSCYVGDFDGNGYLDFVLYSPGNCKGGLNVCITSSFLVLFYNGRSVVRQQVLKDLILEPFPPGTQGRELYPEYKNRAGLAQWGEGQFWINVHFIDTKTGLFKLVPTSPESGSPGSYE